MAQGDSMRLKRRDNRLRIRGGTTVQDTVECCAFGQPIISLYCGQHECIRVASLACNCTFECSAQQLLIEQALPK